MTRQNSTIHRYFQYIIIAFAFFIPLSIAAYTFFAAVLLILWIIEGGWRNKWSIIQSNPFFRAIALFYMFLSLTLLWSDDLIQGFEHLRKYYPLLFIPILYTSLDRRYIPQIVRAFLSAMIISEILSYLIFFDLMPFQYKPSWSSTDPSPFMNHTSYSVFLIFTIFLMLTQLLSQEKNRLQTVLYTFFILTMTINLFINSGRTGQFSLLVALMVFFITYGRLSLIKTLLSTTVITLFIFSIAYNLSPNFHKRSQETIQTFHYLLTQNKPLSDSTGFRFMMWHTAGIIISENPIAGVGVGDDRIAYHKVLETTLPQYKKEIEGFSDYHNTFIQIAIYSGMIGLILFLNIFIAFFRNIDNNKDIKTMGAIGITLILLFMLIGHLPAAYLTMLFVLITSITLKSPHDVVFRH
ncbi:MAG: O-antigen ligase family protein [Sulfuricurvum sp.]|nr:O-antigen ligase family protein [Sulfuricurvum sp.]